MWHKFSNIHGCENFWVQIQLALFLDLHATAWHFLDFFQRKGYRPFRLGIDRSLKYEKFFHHCLFCFNYQWNRRTDVLSAFRTQNASESRNWSKVFLPLFANKNNKPAKRQFIVSTFFFLSFLQNIALKPFLILGTWQFLQYLAFTRWLSQLWRGNPVKFLSCNINFPRSMVMRTFESKCN